MHKLRLLIFVLFAAPGLQAQQYELKSTTEIHADLRKLHRGLRVLYVAAHPDDENTRLISWLENARHIETAYLSLTRGQGGQNLIGEEKGDALGVIRTHELLEARKVDGGQQFFTRAVDFGYSKSAGESFEKWDKEEILADVVYIIRAFRPHVIVTRFPPSNYAGHGHHEASAILAEEAFDLAANPEAFPEQLREVQPWQATSLYHNTSTWWDRSLAELSPEQLNEQKLHKVNIGVFDALRGMGINEIASLARSKHRCQAFGTSRDRGEQFEFLRHVRGEWKQFPEDYKGIWTHSPGHREALGQVIDQYDFTDRAKNLEVLERIFAPKLAQRNLWAEAAEMQAVSEAYDRIRLDLLGLRVEASAGKDPVVLGERYPVAFEAYHSGSEALEVHFTHPAVDTSFVITPGKRILWTAEFTAPREPSNPYWLRAPHGNRYAVPDRRLLAKPVLEDEMIGFTVKHNGQPIASATELHRKWTDRSYGEFVQPMVFVPYAHINPEMQSLVVPLGQEASLKVKVKAYRKLENHKLQVLAPEGWELVPMEQMISLERRQETELNFTVRPGENAADRYLKFKLEGGEESTVLSAQWINYDHIPERIVQQPAMVKLVPVDLAPASGRILYVEGSGDEVDDALALMGYEVDKRPLSGLTPEQLKDYKAVVLGIRALNTNEELASYYPLLLDYARQGGNLVVQYTTTYDLKVEQFGPYDLALSRERVTEEEAMARLLQPGHPVFGQPNEIGPADFEGWVQERGLYFAGSWDEDHYTPLIAWHDQGEEDVKGGLLVATTGRGSFFYTGISFFRELPAGVPGAYRLLMNIIEYQP